MTAVIISILLSHSILMPDRVAMDVKPILGTLDIRQDNSPQMGCQSVDGHYDYSHLGAIQHSHLPTRMFSDRSGKPR